MTTTTTMMITIFPRNRRDIFLLYYVKSECTRDDEALRIEPTTLFLPSRSARVEVWRVVCHLLCCFCQENIRLFSLASWKLSGAQRHDYIILFFSLKFSFPHTAHVLLPTLSFLSPSSSPSSLCSLSLRRLLVRSLSHSFSRYADAILLHNIIWWYIYTINDDRLKQRCVHVIFTM